MFEAIAQGFTGIALFVSQLIVPMGDRLSLTLNGIENHNAAAVVRVKLELPLDPQLEALIDAGMPLRISFTAIAGDGSERKLLRTLKFQTEKLTYSFSDSTSDGVVYSKSYPMILLALKEYCVYETVASKRAGSVKIKAELLPGRLSRINKTVDPRQLFGKHYAEISVNTNYRGKP
ncbi:MAG: hypothetical protein JNL74_06005 [Fibrobacteres bacterium]|nr:hypothetical protein [Fibrobacterota bacterium]